MKWRDQLALLLGAASPLGLAANGSLAAQPLLVDEGLRADPPGVQKDLLVFRDPAERQRLLLFAGHRSHSSHSSHRSHYSSSGGGHSSHSSHYSSSGGSVSTAPIYSPPPTPRPAPTYPAPLLPSARSSPSAGDSTPLSLGGGSVEAPARLKSDEIADMVMKVQIALIVRGYDPGAVDGVLSSKTKAALAKFQLDNKLPSTGFMDLPTLRQLSVVH